MSDEGGNNATPAAPAAGDAGLLDALVTRLAAAMGKPAAPAAPSAPSAPTTPADMISAADHRAALDALRAEAAKSVAEVQARATADIAMVGLGFADDLSRAALRQAWEAEPKGTRGDSPAVWWKAQMAALEAHRADATKPSPSIPATLRAFVPEAPAAKPAPKTPAPPTPGGTGGAHFDSVGAWLQHLRSQ